MRRPAASCRGAVVVRNSSASRLPVPGAMTRTSRSPLGPVPGHLDPVAGPAQRVGDPAGRPDAGERGQVAEHRGADSRRDRVPLEQLVIDAEHARGHAGLVLRTRRAPDDRRQPGWAPMAATGTGRTSGCRCPGTRPPRRSATRPAGGRGAPAAGGIRRPARRRRPRPTPAWSSTRPTAGSTRAGPRTASPSTRPGTSGAARHTGARSARPHGRRRCSARSASTGPSPRPGRHGRRP